MKTVLITGVTGYIGRNVAAYFLAQQFHVVGLVREESIYKLEQYTGFSEGDFSYIPYDGSIESVRNAFEVHTIDCVIHIAAQFGLDNVAAMLDANIILGTQLLELMKEYGVGKFINTGSYSQHNEDGTYNPRNIYTASKQAFEDIMMCYSKTCYMKLITLKLYDVYGPNDERKKLIPALLEASKNDTQLDLTPGEQNIYMVHVEDVTRAYLQAYNLMLAKSNACFEVYFVPGQLIKVKSLVELWIELSKIKIDVNWGARDYEAFQIMEPYVGERLPDWSASISIRNGIDSIIQDNL